MTTEMWKLEKDLCRCCHAEGSFKHLSDPCFQLGQEEIYSDMLQDCLDIRIVAMTGVLSDVTYTICDSCVARLRDASNFKRQVQDCEERFKDMYSKNLIKCAGSLSPDYEVKEEPIVLDSDGEMKQEYQSLEDEDDDDAFMKFDDDDSLDLEEQEELITIEIKGQPKGKGKGKAKPKPKPKKETPIKKAKIIKEKPMKMEAEELTEAAVSGEKKKVPDITRMKVCLGCKMILNMDEISDADKCPGCDQALIKCVPGDQLPGRLPRQAKTQINFNRAITAVQKNITKAAAKKKVDAPARKKKEVEVANDPVNDDDTDASIDGSADGGGTHECSVCKRSFDTEQKLTGHLQRVHAPTTEGDERHECSECKKVYKGKTQLNNHFRRYHRPVTEKDRDTRYKDYVRFIRGEKKQYACKLCDYRAGLRADTNAHVRTHLRSFTCPMCDEIIIDPKELEAHKTQPHSKNSCQTCGEEYLSATALKNHSWHVHKLRKCALCPELVTRQLMKKHVREFHENDLPSCGVCGYKSPDRYRVIQHQKNVHLKEKNVQCNICKLKFFCKINLKRHMVRHRPEKFYECAFCDKQFARKTTLQLHEKIHTGKKDRVCEACGAAFVQKASLNYHMIRYHPDRV